MIVNVQTGRALTSKRYGNNKFRLVAEPQQRVASQLFNRVNNYVVQMAANKNMVWRRQGNQVAIVPQANRSGYNYFVIQRR